MEHGGPGRAMCRRGRQPTSHQATSTSGHITSGVALDRLINDEWRVPLTRLRTDAAGHVRVHGPRGTYALSVDGSDHAFGIDRDDRVVRITTDRAQAR